MADKDSGPVVDLFGHPVRANLGKRGRPPYEPTESDRNKIKLLLALGWSIERLANGIGVSPATVKRYFRAELKVRDAMRDALDARRFELAMNLALDGSVPALKELGKMIERSDMMASDQRLREAQEKVKPEKLGKKAAAKLAAEKAAKGESGWGNDLIPGVH